MRRRERPIMLTYRIILLVKLIGVLTYAGGLAGSFLASDLHSRRRAVHGVASPGLVVTWISGYLLTTVVRIPMTELWIMGGLVFSLASQLALVLGVARDRRTKTAFAAAVVPLVIVLFLMVFRPTWSGAS